MAVRRLTSRAALIRQSSAALLRSGTTPSLLRKTSAINLFPENDDASQGPGIQVYYYSGWEAPHLHYRPFDATWTSPPGIPMAKLDGEAAAELPAKSVNSDPVWSLLVRGVQNLEFVPNNAGKAWDNAPGKGNYCIDQPGRFILCGGKILPLLDPPRRPALIETTKVGNTSVDLVWNPPVVEPSLVAGYHVFRDDVLVAKLGETEMSYVDRELMGLTTYKYHVRAVNELGIEGDPSDTVTVTTGEPGKPSAPRNVHVTAHSETFVDLEWEPPADHGGGAVMAYTIYRNGTLHASLPAISCKFCDQTDIVSGAHYVYHIAAARKLVPKMIDEVRKERGDIVDNSLKRLNTAELPLEERQDVYRERACQWQFPEEGFLSSPCEAKAEKMIVVPRINDGQTHIILQCFNWISCNNKKGWYNVLKEKVEAMRASAITMAWLPPPCQSVSSEGYMPTKWYNLNSKYGTEEELVDLIKEMQASQVSPMLDLVVNHRCGTKQDSKGQWTIYENPDWGDWAIVQNNVQGYSASGSVDTGAQSECAPDIDHTNNQVRKDIKLWTKWLFEKIGFGTVRIDMAPGYSVGYQVEYIEALGNPFAVGEYWNGDPNSLQNYTNGGRGRLAAFDFALYYVLRRCCENNNFEEIRNGNRLQGLVGRDPERAVTFLDNHDTEHLTFVGKFGGGNGDVVLRGYVFILTHPGIPSIYWNHFSDYGDYMRQKIAGLCNARKEAGVVASSGCHIDVAQWGLYAAYISNTRHCNRGDGRLAVRIGSGNWGPSGPNWEKRVEGTGFCVWVRKK